MRIIQEGDGGLHQHKKKWSKVVENINRAVQHSSQNRWYKDISVRIHSDILPMSDFYQYCWGFHNDYEWFGLKYVGEGIHSDVADNYPAFYSGELATDNRWSIQDPNYEDWMIYGDEGGCWTWLDWCISFKKANELMGTPEHKKDWWRNYKIENPLPIPDCFENY